MPHWCATYQRCQTKRQESNFLFWGPPAVRCHPLTDGQLPIDMSHFTPPQPPTSMTTSSAGLSSLSDTPLLPSGHSTSCWCLAGVQWLGPSLVKPKLCLVVAGYCVGRDTLDNICKQLHPDIMQQTLVRGQYSNVQPISGSVFLPQPRLGRGSKPCSQNGEQTLRKNQPSGDLSFIQSFLLLFWKQNRSTSSWGSESLAVAKRSVHCNMTAI